MAAKGYHRPAEVCRTKLKTLRQKFNNLERARSRSGAGNNDDLPNMDILEELLGGRPAVTASSLAMELTFAEEEGQTYGEIGSEYHSAWTKNLVWMSMIYRTVRSLAPLVLEIAHDIAASSIMGDAQSAGPVQ